MVLPAVPSALRGVSQLRGPVFDPRTGTYVYPGFTGSGLSTTGSPPVTPAPATPSPPPSPTTTSNPLGMDGTGGSGAGLRGIQADRVRTGGDGRRGNPGPNGRVDLTGPMGDVLDAVGTLAPGPLGAVATAAKGAMAFNNANISSNQLQAAGYSTGLSTGQKIGAVAGQVSPFGLAGNNYGAGDWRSVLDASGAAQRAVYAGDQTYTDPAGYKTSPMGPVPRTPTYTNRTAPLPGQAPAAPPAGIRSVQAGGSQKSVVDREGREVTDPDIRAMGMLGGTKATGPRPTRPSTRDQGDRGHGGADSRGGEERGDVGDAAGSGGGTSGTRGGTGSYL